MKVTVKAPAKINLTLDIVGRRPDGYHDVAMVMQTVSLYDTVTVEMLDGEGEGIEVSCPAYPQVPTDESNIVCKAARAFYLTTKVKPKRSLSSFSCGQIALLIPAESVTIASLRIYLPFSAI